ncbi:Zinc homeostasis factor 1 [Gracilariopsis chorda]|uniref:Zinc homeostasis factor 1 n=1 Tax=Gracilariopsis chorda TaxID=448386 RepID=A0A2V3J0E3_9FLOR|nr:Zinc homeostasis factor 1 [Gracilariopsis chorda]|eukprot:PXF47795.1 Zinc homeostasis factor 1 [Gracilariopsis chorda]
MPLHNHFFAYDDPSDGDDNDSAARVLSQPRTASDRHATETDSLLPRPASAPAIDTESETRTLVYACGLTTFFFIVELVGGHLARSLAIMSDAAHLLSDLAGFVISLIAVSVSRLPPNAHMSFGFARAEVLGAFVSILFIWALTMVLVVFAIERLFNPQPVHGPLMLILGIIGLLVNLVLGFVLGHGHSHDHGHSHGEHHHHDHHVRNDFIPNHVSLNETGKGIQRLNDLENGYMFTGDDHYSSESNDKDQHAHEHEYGHEHDHEHDIGNGHSDHRPNGFHKDRKGINHKSSSSQGTAHRGPVAHKEQRSANLRAAYLHVLGDALQNVGVIVAAIVMTFKPSWTFIDPLCTLLFAVIVLMTTKNLARETMTVLMEGTPGSLKLDDIHAKLLTLDGVSKVGDLHVWSITSRRPALSVHLYKENVSAGHDVVKDAQKMLAEDFGISHATIQVNCETVECCDEVMAFAEDPLKNDCVSYRPQNGKTSSV